MPVVLKRWRAARTLSFGRVVRQALPQPVCGFPITSTPFSASHESATLGRSERSWHSLFTRSFSTILRTPGRPSNLVRESPCGTARPWPTFTVAQDLPRRGARSNATSTLVSHPAIDRLMNGEAKSLDERPAARFEAEEDALATRFGGSGDDLTRLQSVWLHRMIFTPWPLAGAYDAVLARPLRHLEHQGQEPQPDAQAKRSDPRSGPRQLRQPCSAEMARDPAMLIWLDCTTNRKAHPNENYAREVMELFALGAATTPKKTSRKPPVPSPALSSRETATARSALSTTKAKRPSWDTQAPSRATTSHESCSTSPPALNSCARSCSATS